MKILWTDSNQSYMDFLRPITCYQKKCIYCCQEERDARERMLQEQDDAYKRSLEIDRAKVRWWICLTLHVWLGIKCSCRLSVHDVS